MSIWHTEIPVVMAVFGHAIVPSADFSKAVNKLKANAKIMNGHLKDNAFLAGSKMTSADVHAAVILSIAFQTVFDGGFRKGMSHLTAWFEKCIKN